MQRVHIPPLLRELRSHMLCSLKNSKTNQKPLLPAFHFRNRKESRYQKLISRTSLVIQRLRICLPMQVTLVQSLVWEDPHAIVQLSPRSPTTEAHAPRARAPQEGPAQWEVHIPQLESSPFATTRENPSAAMKTQCSPPKKLASKSFWDPIFPQYWASVPVHQPPPLHWEMHGPGL